jgi:hypothetical protein
VDVGRECVAAVRYLLISSSDIDAGQYNSSNPQPSHYTQVIWKGSKQLGCAYVNCTAGTIFPTMYGQTPFHICEYYPAGNVIGWFSYVSQSLVLIAVRLMSAAGRTSSRCSIRVGGLFIYNSFILCRS